MVFEREAAHKAVAGRIKVRIMPQPRSGRSMYQVGQTYGVQARVASEERQPKLSRVLGKIRITSSDPCLLHEVDLETVRSAGYVTTDELHDHWRRTYRTGPGTEDAVVEVPVLVVRFEPDRAQEPRFMRPGPRGGYTEVPSQAMRGEPECVPEEWQQRESQRARTRDQADLEERRSLPHLSRQQRLAELERLARSPGVDLRTVFAAIDRRIAEGLRKAA